jgi:hypothetical protein
MTINLQTPVVNKLFDDMRRRMMKAEWVSCPACAQEWTKLYECPYFWMDERDFRRDDTTYLCIECAQTPKGFEFITHTWPIRPPFSEWIKIDSFWPDGMAKYDEVEGQDTDPDTGETVVRLVKIFRWGELRTRVRVWEGGRGSGQADFDCTLKAGSENIVVWDAAAQSRVTYLNAVAAWFAIKAKIQTAFMPKELPELPPQRTKNNFGRMR